MDGHDGVAAVIFAGKQALGFEPVHQVAQPVNLAAEVGLNIFPFAAQIEISGNVVTPPHQVGLGRQHIFQALFLPHDLLRLLRVRPESWVCRLLFYFAQLLTELAGVKGTPGDHGLCLSGRYIPARALHS